MAHYFARFTKTLFCLMLFSALGWAQAGSRKEEAQKHFEAGLAYIDDPSGAKWEEALKEFRAAYAASGQWKLQNNIGLCALNLERDGEAIDAYKEYLSKAGNELSAGKRKQIEKDVTMLSASLVRVSVEADPANAIVVDERRNSKGDLIVNQYALEGGKASLGIHPGLHKFTVQAPGYVSAQWTVNAEPASSHTHQVKLEAEQQATATPTTAPAAPAARETASVTPKSTKREIPATVYVGLAATGVFAATAAVTGVVALNKQSEFDKATDPAEEDRLKKSGQTFALVTDICIGAAVLSAGATAYFYFTAPKKEQAETPKAALRWVPIASPHSAGLAVFGKF